MQQQLTRRQLEVLEKLLDLYRWKSEPIHHTALAQYLGVSHISAYEMLRLLESRGMAKGEHRKVNEPKGPGRPAVVFRPTLKAARRIRGLVGDGSYQEWQQNKTRILQQIQNCRDEDLGYLLDELLVYASEESYSFTNLSNIATAILLNLKRLRKTEELSNLRRALSSKELSAVGALSAVFGLGINFAAAKRLHSRLGTLLMKESGQIILAFSAINQWRLGQLADFLHDVLRV